MSQARDAIQHGQSEQEQRDRRERDTVIEDSIERCSRALGRGTLDHYHYIARKLAETIIPTLKEQTSKPLIEYDEDLKDHDGWNWVALSQFCENAASIITTLNTDHNHAAETLSLHSSGYMDDYASSKATVREALKCAAAIAEEEGIVEDEFKNRVDAEGFALKLGEHLQDYEMNIGDPVTLVTDKQVDIVKTLVSGGTGMGKSTGTERFGEDYYQRTFQEGRDYKVMDLLGFRQGENWLPDVPQLQDSLRREREEQGRAPSFAESDELENPKVEIFHPMTRGFASEQLPFDTDSEEFAVTPFTIPASEFRKPVMVSLLMSRLSESEEATIREVYDDVDEAQSDWSLKDLADAIREREELSDKHKSKAIGVLRSLQNEGFIRTHDDPHTLDWDELFRDTETYTVFSQALCDRDLSKLMTFAYLADTAFRKRQHLPFVEECVTLLREFWEVVPHKRRRSFDAREAAVQEAIGQILMKLFRQNRHSGMHVIADTQEPGDLLKSVRELFNHYVVYSANKDTIDDIFEWTQNNRSDSFWGTMTAKAGQAGIVGQAEPALENRDIEFISPVQVMPPSHHHFDVKKDGTGWHARCKYFSPTEECPECGSAALERSDDGYTVTCEECGEESFDASGGRNEELRRPAETEGIEWDDDVPDELKIPTYSESVEEEDRPDPETFPVKGFVYDCLRRASGRKVAKQDVYDAFNEYAKAHGHDRWDFDNRGTQTKFGQKLSSILEGGVESTKTEDKSGTAYQDLILTDDGEAFLDEARVEVESSAAPIRGRSDD